MRSLRIPLLALLAFATPFVALEAGRAQTCFGLTSTIEGSGPITGTAGADVIVGSPRRT